ncbi:DUF6058 family natural product biosynthesis protein [Kribbella sp. NPDC051770]|uniref:DUF6058 family natural product biosynthesis protein n=1 Tax=Kribbella sp. NPDC051770 TaxID=3155413 RepID=UPI00343109AA
MGQEAVRRRYLEINGEHPMTAADDAYVNRQYRELGELCSETGYEVEEVRDWMLAGRLPIPSYLRSDGAEMVPADLFAPVAEVGLDNVREWFVGQWADPATADEEWEAYLSGQYVCLHSVTPVTIQRKTELLQAIDRTSDPVELAAYVDELDALEPEFTGYDRLRFGGPVSRDTHITAVRQRLARAAESSPGAA